MPIHSGSVDPNALGRKRVTLVGGPYGQRGKDVGVHPAAIERSVMIATPADPDRPFMREGYVTRMVFRPDPNDDRIWRIVPGQTVTVPGSLATPVIETLGEGEPQLEEATVPRVVATTVQITVPVLLFDGDPRALAAGARFVDVDPVIVARYERVGAGFLQAMRELAHRGVAVPNMDPDEPPVSFLDFCVGPPIGDAYDPTVQTATLAKPTDQPATGEPTEVASSEIGGEHVTLTTDDVGDVDDVLGDDFGNPEPPSPDFPGRTPPLTPIS